MTTTEYEHNMVLATKTFDVVGTRPIRHDGADKVTGRALYGADLDVAGLLHGKILRSPHAHARIVSIDASKAEALDGVRAVVTAKDFPHVSDKIVNLGETSADIKYLRDNVLASHKVLYQGHAVAGVAAIDSHVAEEALSLIDVEYEVLPPVLTAPHGMEEDAPLLHDTLKTEEFGEKTDRVSNIAKHFQHKLGDIEKGFEEADIVIEREFNTVTVHQGYIEPQNTPPPCGTTMAGYISGAVPRVVLRSGTLCRKSWASLHPGPGSCLWRSAVALAAKSQFTWSLWPLFYLRKQATLLRW